MTVRSPISLLSTAHRSFATRSVSPLRIHRPTFIHLRNMSTEIKQISTPKAAQPVAPYSQAVVAGPHVYVSGQIPARPDGVLVEGSIADKTEACLEGLKHILEAAGSSISRVVKVTIFLDSMAHFAEMNGVYEKYFAATKPARSCVAVKELPKGVPVEVECIALSGQA